MVYRLVFNSLCILCVMPWALGGVRAADPPRARSFEELLEYVEVISGGFRHGNRVLIRLGTHTFFDEARSGRQLAGLYLVAIHEREVIHQFHYNTLDTPGASEGLARDVESFPPGTFVIVAAKDEPTRRFDARGNQALKRIGAHRGLLGQEKRVSYLCIGMKGLPSGEAIEKLGFETLRYRGTKAGTRLKLSFPEHRRSSVSSAPGIHEGLMIGSTEVLYYIPRHFDSRTAEYLFGIHGAGDWHRVGAMNRIHQFKDIADIKNLVIVAPSFDCLVNWPVDRDRDFDENDSGKFKDRRIIKDPYLSYFQVLLNRNNEHRSDLKLIEAFELFNENLMARDGFHLYGHSGGGQFVNRFITFHPELVHKVAISAAGTFTFPDRDKDYPWGLRFDRLEETFGPQTDPEGIRLSEKQMTEKLNRMLDLELHIIFGEQDTKPDGPRRLAKLRWQGATHVEKARNYHAAMRDEHERQRRLGNRPLDDPYRFRLHPLPGVGHDSGAGARKAMELLFGSSANSG